MNNTIRGIPLHTLANSGFFPEIGRLADAWARDRRVDASGLIRNSKDTGVIMTVVAGVMFFYSLVLLTMPQQSLVNSGSWGGWVIGIAVMAVVVTLIVGKEWFSTNGTSRFIRDVRRLDACLREIRTLGLPTLRDRDIKDTLHECAMLQAKHILYCEDFDKLGDEAQKARELFRRFSRLCDAFNCSLGNHGLVFAEAQKQLTKTSEDLVMST